jgi:chromosome segregation ATPase
MPNGSGQNGQAQSRLDRLEGLMELLIEDHLKFRDDLKQLLTAQVVLTDRVDKVTERLDRLTERIDKLADRVDKLALTVAELTEAQKHTDERLNALIHVVDDFIRNSGRPPS